MSSFAANLGVPYIDTQPPHFDRAWTACTPAAARTFVGKEENRATMAAADPALQRNVAEVRLAFHE